MTDPAIPASPVEAWAARIRPHLTRSVDGIVAAGRDLTEAKAALPHGQFGPLLTELGLSPRMAQRFMAVAAHPIIGNASRVAHLPPAIGVLDELTRVPDAALADAIERGDVGPSTTRREAADLTAQHRPVPAPEPEPLFAPGERDAILETLHEEHGDDLDPDVIERAVEDNVESKHIPQPAPRLHSVPAPEPRSEWQPHKPDLGDGVSHPARYSPELIDVFRQLLAEHEPSDDNILDPFAGSGRIHELQVDGWETVGIELEPEWANLHPDTQVGNALDLPFDPETFGAIVTSPTYGNRLADSHNATDPDRRRSYTHDLGRPLAPENSGAMHWRNGAAGSADYRAFHEKAWDEAVLVLMPGGLFILNMCDHVRDGLVQPVTTWHCWILGRLGLDYVESRTVQTRKLRQGANGELREQEYVHVFRKPA